jgi:hypothetical protein
MKAAGLEGEVAVGLDPNAAAPIVLMSVEASSNTSALHGVSLLLEQAPRTLRQIQDEANVRPGAYITTTLVTRDPKAERQIKSLVRLMVLLGVLGIVLTVAATTWADPRLARRAARRRALPEPPVEDELGQHGGRHVRDRPRDDASDLSEVGAGSDPVMHGPG